MQALGAVVFERTSEGAKQVNSSSGTLPRALRSVLLAVDGHSSVARYEPFLPALMPLDEKFAALEQLGLLRRTGSDAVGLVGVTCPTRVSTTTKVDLPDIAPPTRASDFELELQTLSRQMGVMADNSAHKAGPVASAGVWGDMASLSDLSNHAASIAVVPKPGPEPFALAGSAIRLEDLLAEMEAFLSHAVGLDGLPVAIMVAQISSIEQLRLEIPSYSELMRSYGLGAPAEAHIASLESQLASCG